MNKNDFKITSSQIPEFYCAISILFTKNTDIDPILAELNQIGILNFKICNPKYEPVISIDIAIVRNERFWHLSDAINRMFLQIDGCIVQLKSIITKYGGEVLIDIAFYQYGTNPSLVLSGKNMEKIHYLDANVSIDLL